MAIKVYVRKLLSTSENYQKIIQRFETYNFFYLIQREKTLKIQIINLKFILSTEYYLYKKPREGVRYLNIYM